MGASARDAAGGYVSRLPCERRWSGNCTSLTEDLDGRRLDGATDLTGLFDRPAFGVKEILAHRMLRKKLQYLVRWEGCSYLQSTWEDATSLAAAPKVVKAYKAKTKQRDLSLRAESAWTCMTAAPPTIADSSWRIHKGRRYGQRT